MLDINWNALYGFWLVAVHGSYAEASRALPRGSVQALHKRVRHLEDARNLNLRLVQSKGVKGVELTEAGARLYQLLDPTFRNLERVLTELRNEDSGTLRIAATGFSSYHYVPEIIARYSPKYPHVSVHLHMCEAPEVIRMVEVGLADFGICGGAAPGLDTRIQTEVHNAIVVPKGHRLESARISWADLLREPLILPERNSAVRLAFDDLVRRNGLASRVHLKAEMTTPELSLEAVRAGLGVALMPIGPRVAAHFQGLVRRPAPPGLAKLDLRLVCRRDRYLPRYMLEFTSMTEKVFSGVPALE